MSFNDGFNAYNGSSDISNTGTAQPPLGKRRCVATCPSTPSSMAAPVNAPPQSLLVGLHQQIPRQPQSLQVADGTLNGDATFSPTISHHLHQLILQQQQQQLQQQSRVNSVSNSSSSGCSTSQQQLQQQQQNSRGGAVGPPMAVTTASPNSTTAAPTSGYLQQIQSMLLQQDQEQEQQAQKLQLLQLLLHQQQNQIQHKPQVLAEQMLLQEQNTRMGWQTELGQNKSHSVLQGSQGPVFSTLGIQRRDTSASNSTSSSVSNTTTPTRGDDTVSEIDQLPMDQTTRRLLLGAMSQNSHSLTTTQSSVHAGLQQNRQAPPPQPPQHNASSQQFTPQFGSSQQAQALIMALLQLQSQATNCQTSANTQQQHAVPHQISQATNITSQQTTTPPNAQPEQNFKSTRRASPRGESSASAPGLYSASAAEKPTLKNEEPSIERQSDVSSGGTTLLFQPPANPIQEILNISAGKVRLFMLTLEQLRQNQKRLLDTATPETINALEPLALGHKNLADQMSVENTMLGKLQNDAVMLPSEIYHRKRLQLQLHKFRKQLYLYQAELQHFFHPDAEPLPAMLLITEHPFPRSVVKGQVIPLEAQLLLPSRIDVRSVSNVKVDMEQRISGKKGAKQTGPFLENTSESLDPDGKVFFHLRVAHGTNKKPVCLKLNVHIKYNPLKCLSSPSMPLQSRVIESDPSRPFVIITNSVQWRDSEGILMKMDLFGDLNEVPWSKFANLLQTYYLVATRQSQERPTRPLSIQDLEYLRNVKLGREGAITIPIFEKFWDWFGAGLEKIRHQKNLCTLWVKGFIYGFITKEDSETLLRSQEEGVAVIRLSDRFPAKFAAAYIYKKEIHHSLIEETDCVGNKRSIIEFLYEKPHVRSILQVKLVNGQPQVSLCSKVDVLREFINPEKRDGKPEGYEDFPAYDPTPSTTPTSTPEASPAPLTLSPPGGHNS
ncbi:transcriptional repressor [Pelomyxa schiedti]|nr:transcriptional repressor [Pelomyxa schiedti]